MGGGWRRIANVDTSTGGDCPNGWRSDTHSNISFCRPVSDNHYICSSTVPASPLMERVTRGCVVELEDIRREFYQVSLHITIIILI